MNPSGVQWEVFRSGPYDSIVIRFSIRIGDKRRGVDHACCPHVISSFRGDLEAIMANCAQRLIGIRPAKNDELIVQAAQAVRIEAMLGRAK